MPITEQDLRAIIRREIETTLQDLGMLMPYPLEAEPQHSEEPDEELLLSRLNEGVDTGRIIRILNALPAETRERIFNHYKRYSLESLIKTLDRITKASKGSLKPSNG